MRWPGTEPRREVNHTRPIPNGDVHLVPGQPRWADLLGDGQVTASGGQVSHWATEPTQHLPTAPLLTMGSAWRTRRSAR